MGSKKKKSSKSVKSGVSSKKNATRPDEKRKRAKWWSKKEETVCWREFKKRSSLLSNKATEKDAKKLNWMEIAEEVCKVEGNQRTWTQAKEKMKKMKSAAAKLENQSGSSSHSEEEKSDSSDSSSSSSDSSRSSSSESTSSKSSSESTSSKATTISNGSYEEHQSEGDKSPIYEPPSKQARVEEEKSADTSPLSARKVSKRLLLKVGQLYLDMAHEIESD